MGTQYYVSCRDCKVTRDIDKFYELRDVETRAAALELGEAMQKPGPAFRAALLASFMWEHKGHNCTVFSEHDEALSVELDPFYEDNGFKEDKDYWSEES